MLGSDVLLHLEAPTSSVLTGDMLDTGDDLVDDSSRFIARVPPNVRPAPGERVRLRVDIDPRAPLRPQHGGASSGAKLAAARWDSRAVKGDGL